MNTRQMRKLLPDLLQGDLDAALAEIRTFPLQPAISGLTACLYRTEERIKWHAVSAIGTLMNELAEVDMEEARDVMRRLLWSMNEESGGIGWGIPEAMAEIMVVNDNLAREYGHLLISYMREENYLELPAMQRGLMWGIGRLSKVRPKLMLAKDGDGYLSIYLESVDRLVVGLAARAFGFLKVRDALPHIKLLIDDPLSVRLYEDHRFIDTTVGRLAQAAIEEIEKG